MRIKDVTKKVLVILEEKPKTRDSDGDLYYEVCRSYMGPRRFRELTVRDLLIRRREFNLPTYEAVRRARQKMQAEYPELAAAAQVEGYRKAQEQEYKAYARKRT